MKLTFLDTKSQDIPDFDCYAIPAGIEIKYYEPNLIAPLYGVALDSSDSQRNGIQQNLQDDISRQRGEHGGQNIRQCRPVLPAHPFHRHFIFQQQCYSRKG